ncbi:hypothetical protein GGS24DRAFT_505788 [Hypoxylon argillaceum]|nr:hypothetical protein GGS24DRAFT_505788 [Hypoxylon argillaceum]
MCLYRQSIFTCNHTQQHRTPFAPCAAQQAFLAGSPVAVQCTVKKTHTYNTVRIGRLCDVCEAKKVALDRQLSDVRAKMGVLREHLDEAYDGCMKQLDEAGIKDVKTEGKEKGNEKSENEDELDPVQAFLKSKRNEKYSHLMMLGR